MSKTRTTWSAQQLKEFRDWHDGRLKELNYLPEIVKQLTDARERWLPAQTPEPLGGPDSYSEFDTDAPVLMAQGFSRHSPSWVRKQSPEA